MDAQFIKLYAFALGYCESLMRDVNEEEMRHQPNEGVNPPAWLLGHLAIVADSALALLGEPPRLPDEWRAWFGPGSDPTALTDACPSKDELLIALREGHAAVSKAVVRVDEERLAAPNPLDMPMLVRALPTLGDLLAHLLTTHEAMHLGHLSSWRRQMGRPPLF